MAYYCLGLILDCRINSILNLSVSQNSKSISVKSDMYEVLWYKIYLFGNQNYEYKWLTNGNENFFYTWNNKYLTRGFLLKVGTTKRKFRIFSFFFFKFDFCLIVLIYSNNLFILFLPYTNWNTYL